MTAKIPSDLRKRLVFVSMLSALLSVLFSFSPTGASTMDRTTAVENGFDKPVKKQVRLLGPSPYYQKGPYQPQKTLSCFFYPAVLVKQYDEGQKGSEWLSFVRLASGHPKHCKLSHD